MSSQSLLVLKFGGSVLSNGDSITAAVEELSRHLQRYNRIITVVSAFRNHTDALERRARILCTKPATDALAFYMGLGEMRSAGELTLGLQGAGIRATLRMPWDVWFLSNGPPLDAAPVAISRQRFLNAFNEHNVVVFPGFIGRGADGRTHLLGRGGSDLTAIFLAAEFEAERCILLKDAPGIFEWDPAMGARPRRYSRMSWEDAIALGSRMLKREHAEYARSRRVTIEVMAPGATTSTVVGPQASELDDAQGSEPRR
jgi:homoserine dehydrogenase